MFTQLFQAKCPLDLLPQLRPVAAMEQVRATEGTLNTLNFNERRPVAI